MTTTATRRRPRPTPSARPPRPARVSVEFTRTSAAQLAALRPPPDMTRAQLAELVRLEPRFLDHLARRSDARPAMVTDPISVLRAAAPDAPATLLAAVAATHAKAPRLPSGLRPETFRYGVEGRVPLPPFDPGYTTTPTSAPNSLGGFDVCLGVGAHALGRALADRLTLPLAQAIGREFALGGIGTLRVDPPTVSQDAVIGTGVVSVTATAGAHLTLPGLQPAEVILTLELDVTFGVDDEAIVIDVADVRVTTDPAVPGIEQLLGLVGAAVGALFPVTVPVPLPGSDGEGVCDIGLRALAVGLLGGNPSGAPATDPCLGVFAGLLPDTALLLGGLGSPLPAGADAGLFLDNFFLLTQIACTIQDSEQFLDEQGNSLLPSPTHVPQRTSPPSDQFVSWEDLAVPQTVGDEDGKTQDFEIARIVLRVVADADRPGAKKFDIEVTIRVERALFTATADMTIPLTLELDDGDVTARIGQIEHSVTVRVTLLGWLLAGAAILVGAIVGALLAGPAGAAGGAVTGAEITTGVVGVLVVALIVTVKVVLGREVTSGVGPPGPTSVIPQPIVDLFGVLDAGELLFDDLQLTGTLTLAAPKVILDERVLSRQQEEIGDVAGGRLFHLAARVRFDARPTRLSEPLRHQWRFTRTGLPGHGTVLATGVVPSSSGIAAVVVDGGRCEITSALGSDVRGSVSVRATDAVGTTVADSAALDLAGSLVVPLDDLPDDKPDPPMPERP